MDPRSGHGAGLGHERGGGGVSEPRHAEDHSELAGADGVADAGGAEGAVGLAQASSQIGARHRLSSRKRAALSGNHFPDLTASMNGSRLFASLRPG